MNNHTLPPSYFDGRDARLEGKPKIVPAKLNGTDRGWWFCGWNEADQELAA